MEKRKVGILTFHRANNYGGILQAYALQKTVEKITYNDVDIIDYEQKYIRNGNPLFPKFKLSGKYVKKALQYFWRVYLYNTSSAQRKREQFASFRETFLNISKNIVSSIADIQNYDAIIAGSDQIWNSEITKNDPIYYLGELPNSVKKITYAASFGHSNLLPFEKECVHRDIPSIDALSVREDSAVGLIEDEIGRTAVHVLDPTLLLSKEEWGKLVSKKSYDKEEFLLLYSLEANDELNKIALTVASKKNLPIYILGAKSLKALKADNVRVIDTAGPCDYVSLFLSAKFIVTNSFHGTAFSVNFNKDFICVPHKTKGTRMVSLLNKLELSSRILKGFNDLENMHYESVDFDVANGILQREKELSLAFLKEGLLGE